MRIQSSKKFEKTVKNLSKEVQLDLKEKLIELQKADNLDKFDVKKMVGYKDFFRIRMGMYRIGIKLNNNVVELHAIAKRDLIYKIFP